MKLTNKFCGEQILRLQGLPYYASIGEGGYKSLWTALQNTAESESEAEAAITAILTDTARASSTEMNRVPSPGELIVWIHSHRLAPTRYWVSPPPPAFCLPCGGSGLVVPTDWRPDWELEIAEVFEAMNAAKVPCPACVNGGHA